MRNFYFILSVSGIKNVCTSNIYCSSLPVMLLNYVREVDSPQANIRIYPRLPIDEFSIFITFHYV
jgi:hypothetical protein